MEANKVPFTMAKRKRSIEDLVRYGKIDRNESKKTMLSHGRFVISSFVNDIATLTELEFEGKSTENPGPIASITIK